VSAGTRRRRPVSDRQGILYIGLMDGKTLMVAAFWLASPALASESSDSAPLTDRAYLDQTLWNDGNAEVAFYRVERDYDVHGNPDHRSFLMGTYLVKHDYDRSRQSKARSDAPAANKVSAFKWSAFYEFESTNSYQYKYAYVVNAAQADLAPLKASFTSYDWCSNRYRELAFRPDGKADFLMRSDDYGNDAASFDAPEGSYPAELVPLLVRALDFRTAASRRFGILIENGESVSVTASLEGRDRVETEDGEREAERIRLVYEGDVPSILSRRGEREETYWRGLGPERALVALESKSYRMKLVELVRSPYWSENLFPRLKHVQTRP
jgi:hypothetical protein